MSDSDEFVESDEEGYGTPGAGSGQKEGRQAAGRNKPKGAYATADGGYSWTADYKRSWDAVQEDASGSITSAVEGLIEAGKRRRLLQDATPVQRGIIRHLVLILDFSISMAEKDLRPSRCELSVNYACDFVTEYFEQNPISQLAIVGMLDGLATSISPLGGSPQDHLQALQARKKQECRGDASLQNALEMARATLFHVPSHGTREIMLVYGSLVSSDPGDIHKTIRSLATDKIRVRIVGLAASLAICREIVKQTNPGTHDAYSIIMNEYHFKELLMIATTPPATKTKRATSSLITIGFPSRTTDHTAATLCACHSQPKFGGYDCPRCATRVCSLPAECPSCSLTLILSTHLARSYHHLFPLRNWDDVPWTAAHLSSHCFACLAPFPSPRSIDRIADNGDVDGRGHGNGVDSLNSRSTNAANGNAAAKTGDHEGQKTGQDASVASESGRYRCPTCLQHFCIDCDLLAHHQLHECFGCQSGSLRSQSAPETVPVQPLIAT